jgi:large subunit ribosomal protein L10
MASLLAKQAQVEHLKKDVEHATIVLVADYRGLNNTEMIELRTLLRAQNIRMKIAKNTLVKRAAVGSSLELLAPYLKGPTALVLGYGDQVAAVKIVRDYLKKGKKKNELRAAYLDGDVVNAVGVDELANLPPLEELRGKLLMCIASPITGLLNAMNSPATKLARVLNEYAGQKESGTIAS